MRTVQKGLPRRIWKGAPLKPPTSALLRLLQSNSKDSRFRIIPNRREFCAESIRGVQHSSPGQKFIFTDYIMKIMQEPDRPPMPPFTLETAIQKVRMAENAWNTRDTEKVALAYTPDSVWRNRAECFTGRDAIIAFLKRKWAKELDYRLIKEVWAFNENRIAVRFAYEWHDDANNWFRAYGNENWEFAENGQMKLRIASINDVPIKEKDRKYHWPLGPRPENHPGLSDLGL